MQAFILGRVKSDRFLNLFFFFRDNLVSRYKCIQVSVTTESLDLRLSELLFVIYVLAKVLLNTVLPSVQHDTVYVVFFF